MKKKVLVYPCGTEIGLEVHRALRYSTHYELYGGVDGYDHGRFVFYNLIQNLPFIKDNSDEEDIRKFESAIDKYNIDFIYPAMDGVISVFAKYRYVFKEILIMPDTDTAELCRSKRETYRVLKDIIDIPIIYDDPSDVTDYPVFTKPDKGQGSVGARKIKSADELKTVDFERNVVMEYLPGREFTVDCFTNQEGKLVYSRARGRKRIKAGISVNAVFEENQENFVEIAHRINSAIHQKGGWFFQLKESCDGKLKILEVAARIAGTSAISRGSGANLPLMTVDLFNGIDIDDVVINSYGIELDRALANVYRTDIDYDTVYIDYDDTIVQDGFINTMVVKFLYQCVNHRKRLILLSKHDGDLLEKLMSYRLTGLFDKVIHIEQNEQKKDYVVDRKSIFIDDSYGERKAVYTACHIPVFDTHMVECLLED